MKPVVQFDRVTKRYVMHRQRARSIQELVINMFNRSRDCGEQFCSLAQVSFEVARGETVAFIGSNGAGKSTVLKLVSRIIQPTSGQVHIQGRVAGLLELGTGFHPDLTGRENVFLNGSILGMPRAEIARRFDSIIEFAELSRFVDVPVRSYSSGMLMRLGFAVATSVQPDILLIDEVLAVGDQSFQAKCFERISEMQEEGATILFVSHDLDTVKRLCQQAIWLDEGSIQAMGKADDVVINYLSRVWKNTNIRLKAQGDASGRGSRWGSGEAVVTSVDFLDGQGNPCQAFRTGDVFVARIHYQAAQPIHKPSFGVAIYREDGAHVNGPNTVQAGYDIDHILGDGYIDYVIDSLPLLRGRYEFTAAIYDYGSIHPYDHRHREFKFEVQADPYVEREGLTCIANRWEHHCD